jgi:ankyrin repeat and BTB/POZ domain-containing protein 1
MASSTNSTGGGSNNNNKLSDLQLRQCIEEDRNLAIDSWRNDLGLVARSGDMLRVRYLVEHRRKPVSFADQWDASPLFYACLGGHTDVVEYLLKSGTSSSSLLSLLSHSLSLIVCVVATGARCEQNTFDGERCMYAASHREIRALLNQYRTVRKHHSAFETLLHNAFQTEDPDAFHSDVTFVVHGQRFFLHRFLLAARVPYFAEMFQTRWRDRLYVGDNR